MVLGSCQVETFTGHRFEVAFAVGPHCSRVIGIFNPAPERLLRFFSMTMRLSAVPVDEADVGRCHPLALSQVCYGGADVGTYAVDHTGRAGRPIEIIDHQCQREMTLF